MHEDTCAILGGERDAFKVDLPVKPFAWPVDPSWSSEVFPLHEAERLVRHGTFHSPLIELVHEGQLISPSHFSVGSDMWSRQMPDTEKVNNYLERGATMVLNLLHEMDIDVARVARALQSDFNTSVTATAFYTPAETQGFKFHYDSYGAFLLQLSGSKTWNVSPPLVSRPLESQRWNPGLATPERVEVWRNDALEINLRAGEALWIPRGWIHAGRTGHEASWHVTFGLAEFSYIRVLRQLLSLAEIELDDMRSDIFSGWDDSINIPFAVDHAIERYREWLADCNRENIAALVAEEYESRLYRRRSGISILVGSDSVGQS